MEKLNKLTSKVVVVANNNIDTDQIIPARFLKSTNRMGFGEKLFYDWRFDAKGNPLATSPLSNHNADRKILVAGKNFGCGSSREHAAWAILDYGFRVVISSSFADIFKSNALNCGVLPAEIDERLHADLLAILKINPNADVYVNVHQQTIEVPSAGFSAHFPISEHKKECFINGFDDIDYLLNSKNYIELYEKEHCTVAW
jgi:3-isopropylmalate/(R)-2-methylmalate dehydratase small subunit